MSGILLQNWNCQPACSLALLSELIAYFLLYRCSQESKKEGDKEGIYWLEQKKKCQAIRKSVNSRAKALDPHRSLDETLKEKLKQNWSVSSSAQR